MKTYLNRRGHLRLANNGPDFSIPPSELKLISHIDAMLSDSEKNILWHLVTSNGSCNTFDIANLGHGGKGGSARIFATAMDYCNNTGKIYSVDTFENRRKNILPEAQKYIEPYKSRIELCKGRTHDIAAQWCDRKFGIIFIDASHTYENVKDDWKLFSPMINIGGFVSFHDTNQPDTDRVLQEDVLTDGSFNQEYHIDRIKVFKRIQ